MAPVALRATVVGLVILLSGCALLSRHGGRETPETIDLNRGSLKKIERLPGVTPSMARRIVDARPYTVPHDLVERDVLTERELERIADRIVVTPVER